MTPVEPTVAAIQAWLQRVVIGLNLCPFAAREVNAKRVRFSVTAAATEEELLHALADEVHWLDDHPETATTLLIHPDVLQSFDAFNQFLDLADALLQTLDREGVYQIASFHPDYQFAGTLPDAVENYTNRSPYPMLHLLREADVSAAIDHYPDPEGIPERNIQRLRELGKQHVRQLLASCFPPP